MEQFLLPTESFIQLNKRSAPSKQLAIGEICGSKFTKVGENMCRFTSPFTAPSDFFRRDVTVLPHLSCYPRHKKPDLCFQREKDPIRKIDSLSVPHSCRLFISSHLHQFLLSSLTSVTNTHTLTHIYTLCAHKWEQSVRFRPAWCPAFTLDWNTVWWWPTKHEPPLNQHPPREKVFVKRFINGAFKPLSPAWNRFPSSQPNWGTAGSENPLNLS